MKHAESASLPEAEARYLNRELSWLAFNTRVLEESRNPGVPLLERLHFLSISAANLDEFTMVRMAGLKDYVAQQVTTKSIDGMTPEQELARVQKAAHKLIRKQQEAWLELRAALREAGISVIDANEVTAKEEAWLEEHFQRDIFPALTPIAVDPAHPFPFLPNLGQALVFHLASAKPAREQIALVPLPSSLPRFIRLPDREQKLRYLPLEAAVEMFLPVVFPNFEKRAVASFSIVRDSELAFEGAEEDFVRNFERALKQRRQGQVTRVNILAGAPQKLAHFIAEQLKRDGPDVIEAEGMLGMASLKEIVAQGPPELKFKPFHARHPERIADFNGDVFAAIAAKDIVVHHPFESFDVVVHFLRQAAADPNVVSIKQTLYRTSHDSPIARALIEAAEAGKSVTALVELKARFDEEANIRLAREFERVGVQVVYGFVKLKTHAKVSLVTRKDPDGKLVSYVHFGTGNYHPTTAQIYTDLSFFTCDPDLCRDAAYLFNFITGYAPPTEFKKLGVAPLTMRARILKMIDEEIQHAKDGRPAAIWAKMNALVDSTVIDALYRASQAGVSIELVVRGVCCLKPGVAGLSENIRVKSIIGRYLEHARVFCFGAGYGLPANEAKVFIASADWMPRNFDWRVEVMVPIENPTVHEQIMKQIMMANLKDEKQSWLLQPDGTYERVVPKHPNRLSAHEYFMANPSLSGRGKALRQPKKDHGDKFAVLKKPG